MHLGAAGMICVAKTRNVRDHSDLMFVVGFCFCFVFSLCVSALPIPGSRVSTQAFPEAQERVRAALLFTAARVPVSRQPVYLRRCPVTFLCARSEGGRACPGRWGVGAWGVVLVEPTEGLDPRQLCVGARPLPQTSERARGRRRPPQITR